MADDAPKPVETLNYAGASTRGFPTGWRGWLLAQAIMLGVAAGWLLIVFAFSRLVLIWANAG